MTDDLENVADWSATVVRLRAEMFITACVLAITRWLEIDFKDLPFVGVHVEKAVPWWQVLWPLYVLFFYFLISFLVRCERETLKKIKPGNLYSELVATLNKSFNDIESISTRGVEAKDFSDLVAKIPGLPGVVEAIEDGRLRAEELRRSPEPNIMAQRHSDKTLHASEQQLRRQVDELDNSLASALEKIRILVGDQSKARSELGAVIASSAVQFRTSVDKVRSDIDRIRTVVGFDQKVLGYWLPILSSLLLVAVPHVRQFFPL